MKIREIRQKSIQELQKLLEETRSNLVDFRFRVHSGRVKNVHELREARRTVARVITMLNQEVVERKHGASRRIQKNPM